MTPYRTTTVVDLLRACGDEPDDHTPRLMLADALEETGDSVGVEWAELIRLCIEVSRLETITLLEGLMDHRNKRATALRARLEPILRRGEECEACKEGDGDHFDKCHVCRGVGALGVLGEERFVEMVGVHFRRDWTIPVEWRLGLPHAVTVGSEWLMREERRTCPKCNGRGEYPGWSLETDSMVDCRECKRSGTVPRYPNAERLGREWACLAEVHLCDCDCYPRDDAKHVAVWQKRSVTQGVWPNDWKERMYSVPDEIFALMPLVDSPASGQSTYPPDRATGQQWLAHAAACWCRKLAWGATAVASGVDAGC